MDASAIQQLLIDGIPLARFIGLQVDEVGPGMVRLHMPFTPNTQNHLGTAYAGGIFSLAELAGGVLLVSSFDPAQHLMLARRLEIEYLHPGRGTLSCAPRLPDDLVAETRATIAQQGKADLSLSIEVMDADGEVVAHVQATYYLRRQSVTHQDAG